MPLALVPTISSAALTKLAAGLEASGLDPGPVLAEAGVDRAALADPDGRVPITALHAAWTAATLRAPLSNGAWLAALQYAPGDYGLVGFVAMNSERLGEALAHVVRYVGLWTDDPGMRLDEDGTLHVVYRTRFPDGPGFRLATEAAPAEILRGARLLTQDDALDPAEVCFAHPGPADASGYEAFFRAPVRFGQPRTILRFTREQLALPLPKADPQLGEFLRRLADDALGRRREPARSPLDEIRGRIARDLASGAPTLARVARSMATSERTLRRRLDEGGTSFRELLDETRAQLARTYVCDARMPLSEVAFMLGFSETSAFHRAFRRWTGKTPSSFRREGG